MCTITLKLKHTSSIFIIHYLIDRMKKNLKAKAVRTQEPIIKGIHVSILAPAMNPDVSKLIRINLPYKKKLLVIYLNIRWKMIHKVKDHNITCSIEVSEIIIEHLKW